MITVGDGYSTAVEIANLFGHNHQPNGIRTGAINHGCNDDVVIWWPRFPQSSHGDWINTFSQNETRIVERSPVKNNTQELLTAIIEGRVCNRVHQKRTVYVFAQVLPRNGREFRYYFKGVFQFNEAESNAQTGIVWDRTATEVSTD